MTRSPRRTGPGGFARFPFVAEEDRPIFELRTGETATRALPKALSETLPNFLDPGFDTFSLNFNAELVTGPFEHFLIDTQDREVFLRTTGASGDITSITIIPEPSTWLLLASGLSILVWLRKPTP